MEISSASHTKERAYIRRLQEIRDSEALLEFGRPPDGREQFLPQQIMTVAARENPASTTDPA
jgi:hypothetical protein